MEKTKQTLYNFVSVRSPQLAKKDEKDIRFIKIPEIKIFDGVPAKELRDLNQMLESLKSNGDLTEFVNNGSKEFSITAQKIAEQNANLNYNNLKLLLDQVNNISNAQAKILFGKLVENFNSSTNEDFELKERICDWLLLWHLKNNFNLVTTLVDAEVERQKSFDELQRTVSFQESDSESKFRNKTTNVSLNHETLSKEKFTLF